MKILVVCQYYYPEPVRIGDICEELVKKGNEVTVITGIPNYPMGEIYNGYGFKKKRLENINGVSVRRCFTIPRKKNMIMRFLNYYSFAISSTIACRKLNEKYDVVLVNQLSPIIMANGAIKYKNKNKKKMLLYCLDIWPESLKVGGLTEKSLIFKYFHKVSKRIYKSCDKILVTSKNFKNYLQKEFKIEDKTIGYLPQYAENIFNVNDCKKEENETIDLMFAGNMGITQSLDTIIEAANKLQDEKKVYFHFVGNGIDYERIKNKVNTLKLNNVFFHGRKKIDEMPKYYSMADAMLVTLSAESNVSCTVPGKVQSYMAAGKPIIGAINGETREIIEKSKCGFCGKADDVDELVKNIKKFIRYKNKSELGKNSFEYYNKYYQKEKFINELLDSLYLLCKFE